MTFCNRVSVVALLAMIFIPTVGPGSSAHCQTGTVRPDAEEPAFIDFETGENRSLEHYSDKILILNFWATWCKPCLEEMPLLVSIQERYAHQEVQVVGVSADTKETEDKIGPFIRKFGLNFPVWTGGNVQHMEDLRLGHALPATAIIDKKSRVIGRIRGKAVETDLTRYIDWLLPTPPASVDRHTKKEARNDDGHEHEHEDIGPEGASKVPS